MHFNILYPVLSLCVNLSCLHIWMSQYDPNLKEYAKKLKIVYCAAHESLRGTRTMKMVNFNKAGMQYLDEKKALLQVLTFGWQNVVF